MTYQEWIDRKTMDEDLFSACREFTEAMQADFPELRRVRGSVLLSNGWERDHWWLVTPDGDIVDPTASQFQVAYYQHSAIVQYEPRDESLPEPIGKCCNCGELILPVNGWSDSTVCSDRCGSQYTAYLMGGRL